jgi:hypothetical protein
LDHCFEEASAELGERWSASTPFSLTRTGGGERIGVY